MEVARSLLSSVMGSLIKDCNCFYPQVRLNLWILQRRARRHATINVVDVSDNLATCQNTRTQQYPVRTTEHVQMYTVLYNMYGM